MNKNETRSTKDRRIYSGRPSSFQTHVKAEYVEQLDLDSIPEYTKSRFWLKIVSDGMGQNINVPILIVQGKKGGKVLGINAALHGNELNGIPVVQRLIEEIDPREVVGTIIGIPVMNPPSLLRKRRKFIDGTDLNHIMPGIEDGNVSEVYSYRVVDKLLRHMDYLVDLHTASNGRINSFYIRADMEDPTVRQMALLQNAQIIIHNPANDGTFRGVADDLGIPAITVEVGNPNRFQKGMIRDGLSGLYNVLVYLDFVEDEMKELDEETVICRRSFWLYTDRGGLLTVHPDVTDKVKEGQKIATLRNVFGDVTREYFAPEDGIVIGKSVSPVNQTGGRILHLGVDIVEE